MNAAQLPFLVEAILIGIAMVLGVLLGRKAKPYGKVKLSFHLFFFLWFTMGYYYVSMSLFAGQPWKVSDTMIVVMGIALATQIMTGLFLLFSRTRPRPLPIVHGASATLLIVADVVGLVLVGFGL